MALDFPTPATVGETWAGANGVTYTWDGVKWEAAGGGGGGSPLVEPVGPGTWGRLETGVWERSVALAGDWMTGGLGVVGGATIGGPAASSRQIQGVTGTGSGALPRWVIDVANPAPETGGNAGSNFLISRFDDLGVFIDTPVSILRNTGEVSFSTPPLVNGLAAPWVLKTGDTMTGRLTAPYIAALSPSMVWGDTAVGLAVGAHATAHWVFYTETTGALDLGQSDGAGGFVVPFQFHPTVVTSLVPLVSNVRVQGNGGVWFDATGTFLAYASGNQRIIQDNANCYYFYDVTTGVRTWITNGAGVMSLDSVGNLWLPGSVSCGSVAAAGAVTAGTRVHSGTDMMNVSGTTTVANNAAYYYGRFSWDGTWGTIDNGALLFAVYPTGAATYNAYNMSVNQSLKFNGGTGADVFATPNAGAFCFMADAGKTQIQQLGIGSWAAQMCYNTQGLPTGGGAWACDIWGNTIQAAACFATSYPGPSDVTLKQNVVPWARGLAVIRQINTVEYEFTEASSFDLSDLGRKHYGVNAQDIQAVLPEAIHIMKRDRVGSPASSDPDAVRVEPVFEDVLCVESAVILYAMLNAVKEIAARLDAAGI